MDCVVSRQSTEIEVKWMVTYPTHTVPDRCVVLYAMFVCVAVVGLPLLTVTVAPGWLPPLQMVEAAGVLFKYQYRLDNIDLLSHAPYMAGSRKSTHTVAVVVRNTATVSIVACSG